ncbi:Hsp70 family protein [Desulfogranum japonicum]|uniref:Hsp70 family protein n=1 Tax=Desulfogranum japonicum TaxID=231447 RepID=UPI0004164FA6|nr:Hsp70 family protein [Desulfogranum japonicum]
MTTAILGIDLGTTNSEVAFYEDGKVTVIEGPDGKLFPSYVGLDDQQNLLVGGAARNQYVLYPERTIKSIKRLMGSSDPVEMGDSRYMPQEISAMILRHLKQAAEECLGHSIERAVITVPAFFSDQQRRATREAGEIAGLEVVKMINEPTAATLVYESNHVGSKRVLVYDLGGGTFDVSVVQLQDGVIEVVASHGNNQLGGDDFDTLVEEWILEQLQEDGIQDVSRQAQARIKRASEEAKKVLSVHPFAQIEEEYLLEHDGGPYNLNLELERTAFEEMITPLIDETLDSVHVVLKDAGLTASDIDEVLLVGGSTNIPRIQKVLEEVFSQPPRREVDPDLCVASGAALQAAMLSGEQVQSILVDVTPYTFGTSAIGDIDGEYCTDVFVPLITKNSPVPITRSEVFYTVTDNQKDVEVKVYQGEASHALDNLEVGSFHIQGLSQRPAGSEIIATFSLNTDGILQVQAMEKATGMAKSITIDNVLSRDSEESLAAARNRINRLFGADSADIEEEPEEDVGEDNGTGSEPGISAEVLSLIEKARNLMDTVSEDDREDLVDLVEQLTTASKENDTARVEEALEELTEIIFFLES